MENLLLESTEFDLSVMESVSEFTNRMNILDIKLAEESVDEDYYTEAVGKSISDFIKAIIKKITEFAEMIKEKINEFITKQQVMKRIKVIQKEYARNKVAFQGKTIKVFDYRKYSKMFSNYIKELDKLYKDIATRKFKNAFEMDDYFARKIDELERKYLQLSDMDFFCDTDELDECIFELPNVVKGVEAANKLYKQMATDTINNLKSTFHMEKASDTKSEVDDESNKNKMITKFAQNISRISQMAMRNLIQGLKITMSGVFACVTAKGFVNVGRGIVEKDAKKVAKGVAAAGMGSVGVAALKGNMS